MPENVVDILENDFSPEILAQLLRDHTTGRNILWCTHDYESKGEGYQYADEIRRELITGEHGTIIRPRVLKSKVEQSDRVKDMAEVFTPSWVVKMMVDYMEISVGTRSLELTCGEAPFLVSRYDATTGEPIAISERVGLLDRKLRMVNEQQLSNADWLAQVRLAFQTTYGYEWQGDSLLLARENLLYTFVDHYEARFGSAPETTVLQEFAEIISWNLWQMDGLTYRIPREKQAPQPVDQFDLFSEALEEAPAHLCIIKNWQTGNTVKVNDIKRRQTKNQDIMKFDVIIGNPPYQQEAKGANESDTPLYHFFYDESFKVGKKVELISPARFLFNAGGTPQAWNEKMLSNTHLKVLQYESDARKIFPNTAITGGLAITYFNSEETHEPIGVYTSFKELNSIKAKVQSVSDESLCEIIASRGLYRYSDKAYEEQPEEMKKTADRRIAPSCFERMPSLFTENKPDDGHEYVQIYGNLKNERVYRWFRYDYVAPNDNLAKFKVMVPKANGASGMLGEEAARIISKPSLGTPYIGFTETYIGVGNVDTQAEAEAILKYIKSKFARTMLGILKVTQNNAKPTWAYVPLQDFTPSSDIDWSKSIAEIDEQLFDKYGLDEQERNFIRSKVKEMA